MTAKHTASPIRVKVVPFFNTPLCVSLYIPSYIHFSRCCCCCYYSICTQIRGECGDTHHRNSLGIYLMSLGQILKAGKQKQRMEKCQAYHVSIRLKFNSIGVCNTVPLGKCLRISKNPVFHSVFLLRVSLICSIFQQKLFNYNTHVIRIQFEIHRSTLILLWVHISITVNIVHQWLCACAPCTCVYVFVCMFVSLYVWFLATCVSPACAQSKRKNTKTKGLQRIVSSAAIKIITQTQEFANESNYPNE